MPRRPRTPATTETAPADAPVPEGKKVRGLGAGGRLCKVGVQVIRHGTRGALAIVWAHEVPMLRRKAEIHGEQVKILPEWPERTQRIHEIDPKDLRSEYDRLVREYVFKRPEAPEHEPNTDLVGDWVGPFQGGAGLANFLRRVADLWMAFEKDLGGKTPTEAQIRDFFTELDPESAEDELIEVP